MKPAHGRIVWSGTFDAGSGGAGVEDWQYGLNLTSGFTNLTQVAADAFAESMKDVWETHCKSMTPTSLSLRKVTIASVDAAGHWEKDGSGQYVGDGTWQGRVQGTGTTMAWPAQVALVATLTTTRAGSTGKGRIFLPFPIGGLESDRRINLADQTAIADNVVGLINAVNAAATGDVSVASSKGYHSVVTGVKVGRVPDTQRSRRESLLESYYSRGLAAQ